MDKTIGIIFVATLLLVTGVVALGLFTGGIEDFRTGSNEVSDSGCNYQLERVTPETGSQTLSSNCEEEYQEQVERHDTAEEYFP